MKRIAITILSFLFIQTAFTQDTDLLISDGRIGEIKIGDSISKHNYPLINSFKHIGDGYKIFENTYQISDSCFISIGFNYYIDETNTITYIGTDCKRCQFQNGIRPGIQIKDLLAIDSSYVLEEGYGPELSYIKFFETSYVKLFIDNETERKYLTENNKDLQSKILLEGYISAIKLLKINE